MITPTYLIFKKREDEESCHVLRRYKDEVENFLRGNFTDDLEQIDFYNGERRDLIRQYTKRVLKTGIKVGENSLFSKLAYSASQIKNHSIWFLRETESVSKEKIFRFLGIFKGDNPLLVQSRKGMGFSTTKFIDFVPQDKVEMIEDIERNDFNFTDGCGFISKRLAREVNT